MMKNHEEGVTSPASDLGWPAATAKSIFFTVPDSCTTGTASAPIQDGCTAGTVSNMLCHWHSPDVLLPPRPAHAVEALQSPIGISAAGVSGDRAGGLWEPSPRPMLKITPSTVTLVGRTDLGTGSRLVELIVRDFPEVNSIDQLQLSIAETPNTVCRIRGLSQSLSPKLRWLAVL